ncbi:DoxX family membrane protein [Flavobacteriaceae bacterium Ap0902]|nr:DoxX family membrane protein [Flavobacteriaceae bacterium Ap0902]
MISKNLNTGLLLLRVTIGGLMLFHGIRKIEKPEKTINHIKDVLEKKNLPPALANGAYVGEILSPMMVMIGYRTRLFAPIIAFDMLMTFYTVNYKKINQRKDNGAWSVEVPVFFLIGSTILVFTGGGAYALSNKSEWD